MILKEWAAGDVDDGAAALRQHRRQHGPRACPGGVEVEIHAALPRLIRHLERLVEHVRAGIVDENVDATGLCPGCLNEAGDLGLIGDVGLHERGAPAVRYNGVGDSLPGLTLVLADKDNGSMRSKQTGDRLADALASAGDDRALSLETAVAALTSPPPCRRV